jgi:hypothetical protein
VGTSYTCTFLSVIGIPVCKQFERIGSEEEGSEVVACHNLLTFFLFLYILKHLFISM